MAGIRALFTMFLASGTSIFLTNLSISSTLPQSLVPGLVLYSGVKNHQADHNKRDLNGYQENQGRVPADLSFFRLVRFFSQTNTKAANPPMIITTIKVSFSWSPSPQIRPAEDISQINQPRPARPATAGNSITKAIATLILRLLFA